MGLTSDIRKKIEKKFKDVRELEAQRSQLQSSLRELQTQIREAKAAIQAYEEILKLAPADRDDDKNEPKIRPNSAVALARDALRKHGQPMHISKLLEAMGRQSTHEQRISLSGSLAAYVRQNQIFTRPEANTFGLIEWQQPTLNLVNSGPSEKEVDAVLENVR